MDAVADALEGGSLRAVSLAGADPIRRRIVAVERPGTRARSPFLDALWELLERIPDLIPRALPVASPG